MTKVATAPRSQGAQVCTLGLALALLGLSVAEPSARQAPGFAAGHQIAQTYDAIFDARFAEIPGRLRQTCPPAPLEVCTLLDAVAQWWRIQLDPHDTSRDRAFEAQVDAAITSIEGWTTRAPQSGEAWFYLGGAYGARAQWRVLRGERLRAARDGARIKDALERALARDPTLQDAWFGIGLYHYYADVAPAAARMLRWLLFLPGGDKTAGMREMLRARSGGQLLRSEADYQLHLIYLWYERHPERALELLRALHDRHPRNPHFLQRIAEVEDQYRHDASASLQSWRELLEASRSGRVELTGVSEVYARLGIALQLDRSQQPEAAVPHLREVIDAKPAAPYGAIAQAQLQLGHALDRLGSRTDALIAYRAALAAVPDGDRLGIADQARAGLRSPRR